MSTFSCPVRQNSAEVKNLLGRVATLEFRSKTLHTTPTRLPSRGRPRAAGVEASTHTRIGRPILLKREIIATGDQLTSAAVENTQDGIASTGS